MVLPRRFSYHSVTFARSWFLIVIYTNNWEGIIKYALGISSMIIGTNTLNAIKSAGTYGQ